MTYQLAPIRMVLENDSGERVGIDLTHETAAGWHGYPVGWNPNQKAVKGYRVWLKSQWKDVRTMTTKKLLVNYETC